MHVDNRRRTGPAFLALGCVGVFVSGPAFALDKADEVADAADQQANASQIIVNGRYNQDIITPKATAPLINTPRSVAIVSENVIKDTGSATLVDALRTVPGITFGAAEGGNPIGDRPFIRGFDSQGSTYVDGVRDSSAQSREVFAIEQIQVVRGSDSSLGGRGSAGGSLNIITKLPRDRDFANAELSYGTADYKRITADINYRLSDSIAFRVAGLWHDQDVAGRDALWQKRWGVAPSLTIGTDSPTQLTLSWYHLDTDELPDSGIPYLYVCSTTTCNAPTGYTLSEPAIGDVTTAGGVTGHVDRDTFYGLKDRDFRKSKTDQFTARAQHDFGGVTLRNTTRFSHNDQAYILTQPDDSLGNVYNNGLVWRRANSRYGYVDTLTNQTDLFGKFSTGGIEHSFAAGMEFSWEKARRGSFVTRGLINNSGNSAGSEALTTGAVLSAGQRCAPAAQARFNCTSLFAPNPSDPWVNYVNDTSTVPAAIVHTLPIAETQTDADTQSAYLFDSVTLTPWLIANLGLRFDSFKSSVRPGQPIAATQSFRLGREDNIWNWQAGLVAKPTPNTSVYASYSTAATPPNSLIGEGQEGNSFGTANNAAIVEGLKVERTKSYEVGAKADLFNSRLSLNFALFRTETKNARVLGPDNQAQFVGERRIKGLELGFNGEILPKWSVFGGYTYMDAKIVNGGFTALTAPEIREGGVVLQTSKTIFVQSVNTGRQFPQTAKHSFSLWTNVEILPKLNIGGGAFYMSRVFGGYSDNRAATQDRAGVVTVSPATKIIARSVPSYWRFDARASYEISDRVGLSVNVQNLTDKVYFTQAYTNHYAMLAPGRSAFATLSVKY